MVLDGIYNTYSLMVLDGIYSTYSLMVLDGIYSTYLLDASDSVAYCGTGIMPQYLLVRFSAKCSCCST